MHRIKDVLNDLQDTHGYLHGELRLSSILDLGTTVSLQSFSQSVLKVKQTIHKSVFCGLPGA